MHPFAFVKYSVCVSSISVEKIMCIIFKHLTTFACCEFFGCEVQEKAGVYTFSFARGL